MGMLMGFSRLKGIFSSSLNYNTYKDIVSIAKNAECGNIPKDLLSTLLSKGSKSTIQSEIAGVKGAFAEASDTLSRGISVNQRALSIKMQKSFGSAFDKDKIVSLDILKEMKIPKGLLEPSACTRGLEDASKILTERFSEIIPNCAKVEIKPLGSGAFGQGYGLVFLDSNGNKLVHDKVLKVFYKDGQSLSDVLTKIMPTINEKTQELTSKFTKRDIVKMWNNIKGITTEDVTTFLKPYEEMLTKQGVTIRPEGIEEVLSAIKKAKLKDIKPYLSMIKNANSTTDVSIQMFNQMQRQMSQMHGVYAEANTTMFLRKRLGHTLQKTDVIVPDYYNLKKGFSVAELSDDALPKSTSDVKFGLLGLRHNDLHDANKVAGKIIDIGGVNLTTPELSDKVTARYYKKIMNQKNAELRHKYVEQLEKEIESMNDLDKEKIKKAISLAGSKAK